MSRKFSNIWQAAENGDLNRIIDRLKNKKNINGQKKDDFGKTPLMYAAQNGHVDCVSYLVQMGAYLHIQTNPYKKTALMLACECGHYDCVKVLTQQRTLRETRQAFSTVATNLHKDYINHKDNPGNTALSFLMNASLIKNNADEAKYNECLKVFLENGVDPNAPIKRFCSAISPLHIEAEKINPIGLYILLQYGAMVNARDENEETPLLHVLKRRRSWEDLRKINECIRILLERGADPNVGHSKGNFKTALIVETENANKEGVELLLKCGARINMIVHRDKDSEEFTALGAAVQNKNLDITKFLLEKGASPNMIYGKESMTVLMRAAQSNFLEGLDLLVKYGAKIDERDPMGKTALIYAAECAKSPECLQFLLEHKANPNHLGSYLDNKCWYEISALMTVAKLGYEDSIKTLLDYGAKLNLKTKKGYTALSHLFAGLGGESFSSVSLVNKEKRQCLDLFLEKGAETNVIINDTNITPAMIAAKAGDMDLLKKLLTNGADLNATDSDGNDALRYAVLYNKLEIVEFLVDNGVSINRYGRQGHLDNEKLSPLMIAAENRYVKVIKFLLKNGAEVNSKNINSKTAISYLMRHFGHWSVTAADNLECLRLLLEHGADPNVRVDLNKKTSLMCCAKEGNLRALELLIKYNAQLAEIDNNSMNALHYAILYDHTDCARALIDKGLKDLNALFTPQDKNFDDGVSPLMIAARYQSEELIELLLLAGADVNLRNSKNKTALSFCEIDGSAIKTLELLLQKGADPNAVVDYESGKCVVMKAAEAMDVNCLKLLFNYNVDVNKTDKDKRTALSYLMDTLKIDQFYPLQYGTEDSDVENDYESHEKLNDCVELLIKYGANPNVICEDEKTPLFKAVCSVNVNLVQVLIKGGADVHPKGNSTDCDPLFAATRTNRLKMIKLLLQETPESDYLSQSYSHSIEGALDTYNFDLIKMLLDDGAIFDRFEYYYILFKKLGRKKGKILKNRFDLLLTYIKQGSVDAYSPDEYEIKRLRWNLEKVKIALYTHDNASKFKIVTHASNQLDDDNEAIQDIYAESMSLKNQTIQVIRESLINSKPLHVKESKLTGNKIVKVKNFDQKLEDLELPSALKDEIQRKNLQEVAKGLIENPTIKKRNSDDYDYDGEDDDDEYDSYDDTDYDDDDSGSDYDPRMLMMLMNSLGGAGLLSNLRLGGDSGDDGSDNSYNPCFGYGGNWGYDMNGDPIDSDGCPIDIDDYCFW